MRWLSGDTDKAYELWKPTPSYRKDDFLADWGPSGYYGPVKSYKIMGAKAPDKSDSIAVNVAVSPYSPTTEVFRRGKKPQDKSGHSVGFTVGQVVELSHHKQSATRFRL